MKELISLDELTIFLTIAQTGSLTAAAKKLAISLPTISRRLSHLENIVGGRLINRSTRSISLTTLGSRYFEQCFPAIDECLSRAQHISESTHQLSGQIKITAPINLTNQWLAECIFSFMEIYPEIKIELMVSNRLVDLTSLNIDIAIRVGVLKDNDWIAKKLADSINILCASPQYIAKNGVPTHPTMLENHKLICTRSHEVWSLSNTVKPELFSAEMSYSLVIDDITEVLQATKHHLGICFVPYQFAGSAFSHNELVRILPNWQGVKKTIYLMYRDRKYLPTRMKVFKEYVEQYALNCYQTFPALS